MRLVAYQKHTNLFLHCALHCWRTISENVRVLLVELPWKCELIIVNILAWYRYKKYVLYTNKHQLKISFKCSIEIQNKYWYYALTGIRLLLLHVTPHEIFISHEIFKLPHHKKLWNGNKDMKRNQNITSIASILVSNKIKLKGLRVFLQLVN